MTDEETARPEAASQVDDPNRVSGYTLVRRIGAGGFGAVFEARPLAPPQVPVAIKILDPLPFDDLEDGRKRYFRETEAVARLSHRAIVRFVAPLFTKDGVPALVMDLVDGVPLREAAATLRSKSAFRTCWKC